MKDLTKGNIIKLLLAFSIPLLIGNVFQQLYNIVDTKVVGEFLGSNALAAIGASSPLFSMIMGALNGMGNGFGIVISKFYGAKDPRHMKQAVANSIVLAALISVIVTILAMFMVKPLLLLLNTPEEILQQSMDYIRIIILFMIVTTAYNLCAGMLRALGDTIRPLIFLAISTVINVGLDLLFVGVLQWNVQGAAYATVIAQIVSFVCCIVYIIRRCPELHVAKEDFVFEGKMVGDLLGQGGAMAFMLCFVYIGTLILQGAINSFGTDIIAAHTIARKVSELGMVPFSTFGVAAATFTGQNYGAGEYQRIRKGAWDALIISWIWSAIVITVVYAAAPLLIRLISGVADNMEGSLSVWQYLIRRLNHQELPDGTKESITQWATWYLQFDTPFYFVLGIVITLRNALQGLSQKIIPMIASGIELLGKLIVAWVLAERIGYWGIIISEPVTWILMALLLGISFLVILRKKEGTNNITSRQVI